VGEHGGSDVFIQLLTGPGRCVIRELALEVFEAIERLLRPGELIETFGKAEMCLQMVEVKS